MKKLLLILITIVITSVNAQAYQSYGNFTSNKAENLSIFNEVETVEKISNSLLDSYLVIDNTTFDYEIDSKIEPTTSVFDTFLIEETEFKNELDLYDRNNSQFLIKISLNQLIPYYINLF